MATYQDPIASQLGTLASGVSIIALTKAGHPGVGVAVLEFPLTLIPGQVSLRYVGEPSLDEGLAAQFFIDVVDGNIGNTVTVSVTGTASASDYTVDVGGDLPFSQDGNFSIPVTIQLTEDDLTEGEENIIVALTNYTGVTGVGTQSYTITVNDTSTTVAPPPPVLNPPDPASPTYITLGGGMGYSTGTTKSGSYTVVGGATYRFKFPRGNGYRIRHRASSGSGTYVYLPDINGIPLTADAEVERNFDFVDTYHAQGVSGNRYFQFEIMEAGGFFGDATHLVKFYKVADGVAADAPSSVVLSSTAPATVNEGSDVPGSLAFTDANAGQTVDLSVVGDHDYVTWGSVAGISTSGKKVTITADGSYTLPFTIHIPEDALTEGAENLTFSLVTATNGLSASGNKTVGINDSSLTPTGPATPTLAMTRPLHGSVINEGDDLIIRFAALNAAVGASWEVTGDNSPLTESDFLNSLTVDANAGKPVGITASVTGRTVKYEVVTAGSYTFDLKRRVKLDATTEGTDNNSSVAGSQEQINLKLQNVVDLTVQGGTLISCWVTDTSLSPPYVPPTGTVTANPISVGFTSIGGNLAGAEFGTAIYPRTADLDWFIANFPIAKKPVERVPFKMSRALAGGSMLATSLNPTWVTEMTRIVNKNHAAGIITWLDAHDYGRFGSVLAGTGDYNATNVKRWWRMISDVFVGKKVIWGLQNEPHDQNADLSWQMQVASYQGIRESGHLGDCLFSHTGWAGVSQALGETGAIAKFRQYTEGLVNCALELHSYPDADSSGTTQDEALDIANGNTDIWVQRWTAPIQAAENAGVRIYIGEFGCGFDANSLSALSKFRTLINAHPAAIQGFAWWAFGPWNSSYIRAIGPGRNNGQVQYLV